VGNFLAGFKKVTHAIAVAGIAAIAWAVSPQGQHIIGGIVQAYPKLSAITTILGFLAALYSSPKTS
jgi:hypothetical protein